MNWYDDPRFKREIGAEQTPNVADLCSDVTVTSHSDREKYCIECKHNRAVANQSYCGATCRKRAQRRREQVKLALSLAMYELGKIRDTIKRREYVIDPVADLKRLKAEINDLLLLAGDKDEMARVQMLNDRSM